MSANPAQYSQVLQSVGVFFNLLADISACLSSCGRTKEVSNILSAILVA